MSLNQKFFLKINAQVGMSAFFDRLMIVSARWLIYVLLFAVLLWGEIALEPIAFKQFIKFFLTSAAGAIITSWIIALLFRHHRPVTEFPEIKTLVHPLQNWKSFPSDHTAMSMIFALLASLFGASAWFVIAAVVSAVLVAFGRIYVGVHYPRDIVAGWFLAVFYVYTAGWWLANFTQPIYDFLISL